MKLKTIIMLSLPGGLLGGAIGASESNIVLGAALGFLCPLIVLLLMKAITSGIRRACNKTQLYLCAIFIPLIPGLPLFLGGAVGIFFWLVLVFIFEFMLFSSSSPAKPKRRKENGKLDAESDFAGKDSQQGKTIDFLNPEMEEMSQRSPAHAAFVEALLDPKPVPEKSKPKADLSLFFEKPCDGGSGNSLEDAIIISAPSPSMGVFFEYAYIQIKCGERDVDWKIESQSLLEGAGGKPYDLITVRLKDGTARQFCFDISSVSGRGK